MSTGATFFRRGWLRVMSRLLFGAIGFSVAGFSQAPARAPKVLTPEQRAFQQQMRVVDAKRAELRVTAKQAFDAEVAREKAGDCPDATTTLESNGCLGEAVGATEQNFKTYTSAVRDLLGLRYSSVPVQPLSPGPSGPQLTSEEELAEFDQVEQLWHAYLDAATKAAFHQFSGGTGGPSFKMESHLRLIRDHMMELNTFYGMLFL